MAKFAIRGLALLAAQGLPASAAGTYVKERSYMGDDFFSKFWFWKWPDLTHGHVHFVDEVSARAGGLLSASSSQVYMSADRFTSSAIDPRPSLKIFSNDVYNSGLFVISLDHLPSGCGTWPAFWMTGGNSKEHWPSWGEFDIIEGVHLTQHVGTALHTSKGCSQAAVVPGRDFEGSWQQGVGKPFADDCYVQASGQWANQGCQQIGPSGSMGAAFNAQGGGTYAAEWSPMEGGNGFFRTWFFRNGTEPADLLAGKPRPASWGKPYSYFALDPESCPQSHFRNMRLVFDLTFCGDMAGASFAAKCPVEAAQMTCQEFVSRHPEALKEAYWSIRRLETYQWHDDSAAPPAATPAPQAKPGPKTCKAIGCDASYDSKRACQCDQECLSFQNCCPDADAVCGVRKEATPGVFHAAFLHQGDSLGDAKGAPQRAEARQAEAMCSAHPACARLEKDCCPTAEGMMLDCCTQDFAGTSPAQFKKQVMTFMKRFELGHGSLGRWSAHPALLVMGVCAACALAALGAAAMSRGLSRARARRSPAAEPSLYATLDLEEKTPALTPSGSLSRTLRLPAL